MPYYHLKGEQADIAKKSYSTFQDEETVNFCLEENADVDELELYYYPNATIDLMLQTIFATQITFVATKKERKFDFRPNHIFLKCSRCPR